jgi:hypothetical protein
MIPGAYRKVKKPPLTLVWQYYEYAISKMAGFITRGDL